MIPVRKVAARKAKAVFYREINDVDIFIEDTERGSQKLYSIILSKAIGNHIKLNKVFPLGGKNEVIKMWEMRDKDSERNELFIIDADLSIFTTENCFDTPPDDKSLFILPRFCIENFLINENAALSFLYEEHDDNEYEQLKRDFNFTDWKNDNHKPLFDLFVHYAILSKIDKDHPTISLGITGLLSDNSGVVDQNKVQKRCDEITEHLMGFIDQKEYQLWKKKVAETVSHNCNSEFEKCICGKHYLFKLYLLRLKTIAEFKIPYKKIKRRIALHIDDDQISNEMGLPVFS